MKVLGRGWQYTAYDLGNGRVLKKYNSFPKAYWIIFWTIFPFKQDTVWKIPSFYKGCKDFAKRSMKLVTSGALDGWMMGNPNVLDELNYEQDKMSSLHDCINGSSVGEAKAWVDKFVEFNKVLVGQNIIDKSFNITKNFGVDTEGRVVLMDLGELYADKVSIDKQRRKRQWTYPYVAGNIRDQNIKAYYIEEMDKAFGISAPKEIELTLHKK